MSSGIRWTVSLLSVCVGIHATATPAAAQDWRARGGSPPGRAVRVEQGRARPCPPGHERRGLCDSRQVRRGGSDWCLDRNRDARCDNAARGRGNRRDDPRVVRRDDRRADRRDDRRNDGRGRPGGWDDIYGGQGRASDDRGSLADRLGDLVRQAQQEAQRRGR